MRVDNNGSIQRVTGARLRHLLPAEEPSGTSTDSVQVSARAADISAAMEALQAAPEVREERVVELTSQLQHGTLVQDGSSLADKLLRGSRG